MMDRAALRLPQTADGLLLVDKPAGMTSHDVVDRVRRLLSIRRIGHAGTLDPFATGLLVLLINRATRLLPFLDGEPKVYQATIRFGARTTTDDTEGSIVLQEPPPEQQIVERAIRGLTGHVLQRPPAYSAKKLAGTRAYRAARRGTPLELDAVGVTVYEWRILARRGADLDVEIECSAGTYVRALARDLGEVTGSAAHLAALRRLRSGRFDISQALPLETIEKGVVALIPSGVAVQQLPWQELDDLDAQRITHGREVAARVDGDVIALRHQDALLAVAVREGEQLRPKVVLRDA
jgi:tRNA pseudouridine55 synthase